MKQQWFLPQISLGTLIQLVTMVGLAAGAYYKFDARVQRLEEAYVQQRLRLDDHETTIRSIANSQTRITTILEERERNKSGRQN